jgi:hypothetical protein
LVNLYLDSNQLTGAIPSEVGSLSQLADFSLFNNQLTGTIPSEIGSMSQLVVLYLHLNQFSQTIPSEIGSLSQLGALYLHNCQLTGAIPSELGSLFILSILYLYNNHLTGVIPSEIGSLSQLIYLSLYSNQLTRAIPSEIGSFSQLSGLYLSNNHLTGSLPSEIGSLSQLGFLYLDRNQLSGAIPSSFSNLAKLVHLSLHRNHLKGSITFQLTSFPRLQQIFLHQNCFTGQLDLLFSSNALLLSSSNLLNLDLSDNLLSGSIPSSLFIAPHLQSISLSLNCFEHELPPAICEATSVNVISMDGLGSAEGCKNVLTLPFTSVSLVRSMDGSIPNCVWSMSNLTMLNIAGNGLRGRITSASTMSSLLSLTLSHNHLSGEIPLWLEEKDLIHLDLSHNKFTGDATGFRYQDTFNKSHLNSPLMNGSLSKNLTLRVNRLSGDLPSSLGKYADLDILSGNLFGCDHPPKNDKNSDYLSCGSEQYDQSTTLMGGVLGMIVCLVAVHHLLRLFSSLRFHENKMRDQQLMLVRKHVDWSLYFRYMRYYQSDPNTQKSQDETIFPLPPPHPFQSTISFGSLLSHLMWSTCVLTTLCLLLSLPVYVLKQLDLESTGETQYITHTHMYNWLWTMTFVSGTTPAIILLVAGFVCLLYFNVAMNRLGGQAEPSPSLLAMPSKSVSDDQGHFLRITAVWIVLLLNIVIVGTVNGLYIWSTLHDITSDVRVWIQISFALFSSLWRVVLRRGLPSRIKESRYGVWLFICLSAMNSVLIPCVVTALSTPSCYQVSAYSLDFDS